jgi:hypothetical protein
MAVPRMPHGFADEENRSRMPEQHPVPPIVVQADVGVAFVEIDDLQTTLPFVSLVASV